MINLEQLWRYQQSDLELEKFEMSIRETPNYKKYSKLRGFIVDQRKTIQKLSDAEESKRARIEAAQQKCKLLQDRYQDGLRKFEKADKADLEQVEKFKKYFEQILNRISQERRDFSVLVAELEKEDELLSSMRVSLAKIRKEYDELKIAVEAEKALQGPKIEELKKKIRTEEKKVDPGVLAHYNTVRKSHSIPMSRVANNKCMGCNMELPAVVSRKLREGNEVVECESCGRILYLEDNDPR